MLINFIGTFNSGKTTLASKLFSYLKERNHSVEFIPEQARIYIANIRVSQNLKPEDKVRLFNSDQLEILIQQYEAEKLMLKACGDETIIITDSSIYNSLLYMDIDYIQYFANHWLDDAIDFYNKNEIVTFLCETVEMNNYYDPNRIHTEDDLESVNDNLNRLFGKFTEASLPRLEGSNLERLNKVYGYLVHHYNIA